MGRGSGYSPPCPRGWPEDCATSRPRGDLPPQPTRGELLAFFCPGASTGLHATLFTSTQCLKHPRSDVPTHPSPSQTSISLAQLQASPLSPLLPALPAIGSALAGARPVERETGIYGDRRVVSDNTGGLFCWDKVASPYSGNADDALKVPACTAKKASDGCLKSWLSLFSDSNVGAWGPNFFF